MTRRQVFTNVPNNITVTMSLETRNKTHFLYSNIRMVTNRLLNIEISKPSVITEIKPMYT